MTRDDVSYYRRRLSEEEALATGSDDPVAARAHAELAELYRNLLAASDSGPEAQTQA